MTLLKLLVGAFSGLALTTVAPVRLCRARGSGQAQGSSPSVVLICGFCQTLALTSTTTTLCDKQLTDSLFGVFQRRQCCTQTPCHGGFSACPIEANCRASGASPGQDMRRMCSTRLMLGFYYSCPDKLRQGNARLHLWQMLQTSLCTGGGIRRR